LALAFVGVAVGAIVLLTMLVLLAAERDVTHLARQQQTDAAEDVARAAGSAYSEAGGWSDADLQTALVLAADSGGRAVVVDGSGRPLTPLPAGRAGQRVLTTPVVVDGTRVGSVQVAFPGDELSSPQRHLRDALAGTVVAAAGLAALAALGVGVAVSRRIARPVVALTDTARAVEGGDRSARVGPLDAPGELGELAVAFDRMADTLAAEDDLRRALVADVAHELRTPLSVLQATLEAMADGLVETTGVELSALRDDVLRIVRIVEDLETLSAADAVGLNLQTTPVDLAEVALDAAGRLGPQFRAAGLNLTTAAGHVIVKGDRYRLHQVVTNLLTNSLKFTAPGGSVHLDVKRVGGDAHLTVDDTGVGITTDELPHVFDRFWRSAQARQTAGSGIGLTVVDQLVQAHSGTVAVDSEPGRGTTVRVALPLA
jgi:two-component system sensor histidine kinase BaeS